MNIDYLRIENDGKSYPSNLNHELLENLGIYEKGFGLPLDHYSIGGSSVTISPKRGASIPSLILDGKEIFYNDPSRRNDFTKAIREGFWMGPQVNSFNLQHAAKLGYTLNQHGFLRDFERKKVGNEKKNEIKYLLKSNKESLEKFPHSFKIYQTIVLNKNEVRIVLDVENISKNNQLPFAPGHHTYYKVPSHLKNKIEIDDNLKMTNKMKEQWINGEESIIVPNPDTSRIWIPGAGEIENVWDPKFKFIQFRSEKEKDFVCVEPIVDVAENRDTSKIMTQPGEIMNIGFSTKLLSKDSKFNEI